MPQQSHGIARYRAGCRCPICTAAKAANSRKWYHSQPRTDGALLRRVWSNMLRRCEDSTDQYFKNYGGRGIQVCPEWHDLDVFRGWAKGGFKRGLEIDRIDNDGPYCPENCRWVTPIENRRHTRRNKFVTAWGETKTISAWIEDARCTVHWRTAYYRLSRGWAPEVALTTPAKGR